MTSDVIVGYSEVEWPADWLNSMPDRRFHLVRETTCLLSQFHASVCLIILWTIRCLGLHAIHSVVNVSYFVVAVDDDCVKVAG